MSATLLVGRMALSLLVVMLVMAAVAYVARRRGSLGISLAGGAGRGRRLQVLSRHPVSKAASLAVVKVGERELLIGVTPSNISLLMQADPGELSSLMASESTEPAARSVSSVIRRGSPMRAGMSPWSVMLDQLRDRTVRRA